MKPYLLFDCDGTLVDSETIGFQALVDQFSELGISLNANELTHRFRGCKLAVILDTLSQEHSTTLPDGFVDNYRLAMDDLFVKELKPIKYIKQALEQLTNKKAVVSSGPSKKISRSLELCGLSDYFSQCFSSYDNMIWKPDPRVFSLAAKELGVSCKDCIVIEDGEVGVKAALGAGMICIYYNAHNYPSFNTTNLETTKVVEINCMSELAATINEIEKQLI